MRLAYLTKAIVVGNQVIISRGTIVLLQRGGESYMKRYWASHPLGLEWAGGRTRVGVYDGEFEFLETKMRKKDRVMVMRDGKRGSVIDTKQEDGVTFVRVKHVFCGVEKPVWYPQEHLMKVTQYG